MKTLEVRILSCDCDICRDELIAFCNAEGLPLPAGRVIDLPESWIDRRCEHGKKGIAWVRTEAASGQPPYDSAVECADVEAPDGWLYLSAMKGIGYSAREQGRYGSYPAHDRYDGDSES